LADVAATLKTGGTALVAASARGSVAYDDFDWRSDVALAVGAEGSGFSAEDERIFDALVKIPMKGAVESLNAAAAADGTLLVTMGDRSITPGRMQAQNMDSLIGKIARINKDGTIPKDNPWAGKGGVQEKMWSIGHRNVQAATLHPTTGELWEVEHGTRGGDELNVAKKGKDYGWPTIAYGIEYQGPRITGDEQVKAGMEQPVYYWDPNIAPSGMTFYTGNAFPAWKGSLFIGGLGGNALVRLTVDGEKVTGEERLLTENKERIRDVVQGPDGALYVLTDNKTMSRLFKIVPKK
jgi:glucose/arabinose dehydrogenase